MKVQLRNIRHFSQFAPGDLVDVPDGAEFDPHHWEAVAAPPPPAEPVTPAEPAAAAAPRLPVPAKEM
jgi:hypothetical protein